MQAQQFRGTRPCSCNSRPVPSCTIASRGRLLHTGRLSCSSPSTRRQRAAICNFTRHALDQVQLAATAVQSGSRLGGQNQPFGLSRRSHVLHTVVEAVPAAASSAGEEPDGHDKLPGNEQGQINSQNSSDPAGRAATSSNRRGRSSNNSSIGSTPGNSRLWGPPAKVGGRGRHGSARGDTGTAAVDSQRGVVSGKPPDRTRKGRPSPEIGEDIKSCSSIQQLQQLVQQDIQHMSYVNLSAAIVKVEKLISRLPVQRQQQQQQQAVIPQSAALLHQLWQLQQPKLVQCKTRQLANMIYALCLLPPALQQQYQQAVTMQLLPAFMQQLQQANPQQVANVLYAVAKSGAQLEARHIQQLLLQLLTVVTAADSQETANAVWAVATMGQQIQPKQLQQLLGAFASMAHTAKPQAISNILWAVATMGQQLEAAQLQQMLDALTDMATQAQPQAISNTLWAVAMLQQRLEERHLQQLLKVFVSKLGQATSQQVSNTLLACARFGYLPEQLLRAPGLLNKLLAGTPQNLANAAWACGQLGYRDEQLLAAIVKTAVKQTTGQHSGVAIEYVLQYFSNMCWSMSVLNVQGHAADVLLLAQKCLQQWGQMVPENFSQLYQVHLWLLDHQLAGGQGLLGALTEQQLQQCKAAWDEQMSMRASAVVSEFQQSVFSALQQLSSSGRLELLELPQMEQVSLGRDGQPDGAALIDITARTADGVMLAIEADGPTHFRRPDGGFRGATLYRNRALAVRGYTVVSIPYYEWPWGSKQAQEDYLLQQIQVATKAQPQQQQRLQAEPGTPARAHKSAHGGQLGTKASSSTAVGNGSNNSSRVRRIRRRS